jgi:hypothetical protein
MTNSGKEDFRANGVWGPQASTAWVERRESDGAWSSIAVKGQGLGWNVGHTIFPAKKTYATYETLFYDASAEAYVFDKPGRITLRAATRINGKLWQSPPVQVTVSDLPVAQIEKLEEARQAMNTARPGGTTRTVATRVLIEKLRPDKDSELSKYIEMRALIADGRNRSPARRQAAIPAC